VLVVDAWFDLIGDPHNVDLRPLAWGSHLIDLYTFPLVHRIELAVVGGT
jgi:hypothetical protein